MNARIAIATVASLLTVFLLLQCGDDTAGNGTDTGNAAVAGVIYQSDGHTPAANVSVCIRVRSSLADTTGGGQFELCVTTDADGRYRIHGIGPGVYVVEATSGNDMALADSVVVTDPSVTNELDPHTLSAAGAIKGVLYLSEGGDPRKVLVLAYGVDRFARVDSAGRFRFTNLADARYDLRFVPALDSYGVLDTQGVRVVSGDTTDLDTVTLPFTGIPTPRNVVLAYDTAMQVVTLTWDRCDPLLVASYNVYRRNVDSNTVLARVNTSPLTDTVFRDSIGVAGETYEYEVVALDANGTEGARTSGRQTLISSYFLVDSICGSCGSGEGQFLGPTDVAVGTDGLIYVAEKDGRRVQVLNDALQYQAMVGGTSLSEPLRVAVGDSGEVYVRNGSSQVWVFAADGSVLRTISAYQVRDIGAHGSVLYLSTWGDSVVVTAVDGARVRAWGGTGSSPGKMAAAQWLDVGGAGIVVVSDQDNQRVQIFDTVGTLIHTVGLPNYPGSVVQDGQGRVLVIENGKVLKAYDSQGRLLARHRFPPYGAFTDPMGMAVAADGSIYVVLQASCNLLKMRMRLP